MRTLRVLIRPYWGRARRREGVRWVGRKGIRAATRARPVRDVRTAAYRDCLTVVVFLTLVFRLGRAGKKRKSGNAGTAGRFRPTGCATRSEKRDPAQAAQVTRP